MDWFFSYMRWAAKVLNPFITSPLWDLAFVGAGLLANAVRQPKMF